MTMQINRQALRSIIPDEARLLFAEQIPLHGGIILDVSRMNRIKTALDPKHILNDQKSYIVGGK